MNDKTNCTATLLRGGVYYFGDQRFERDKPVKVTGEVADQLEELFEEVRVGRDDEKVKRPLFEIVRNATTKDAAETKGLKGVAKKSTAFAKPARSGLRKRIA
jgi:hypothetical protein